MRRIFDLLPTRFGKYGLTLHPEKIRIVMFPRHPRWPARVGDERERRGSFDYLGFTHLWGHSRAGYTIAKR